MVTSHSAKAPPGSSSGPSKSSTCRLPHQQQGGRPPKSVYRRVVNLFKQAWTGVKFALGKENLGTFLLLSGVFLVAESNPGLSCAKVLSGRLGHFHVGHLRNAPVTLLSSLGPIGSELRSDRMLALGQRCG